MLTAYARAHVLIAFEDREGNRRTTSLTFPFSLPVAQIHTYMDLWIDRVRNISNAGIRHYVITHSYEDEEPPITTGDSSVQDKLTLYYSSDAFYDRIYIPALRRELLETGGLYAGVRLDVSLPEVIAILESMESVVAYIVTPEGEPFPSVFVVGGMAL